MRSLPGYKVPRSPSLSFSKIRTSRPNDCNLLWKQIFILWFHGWNLSFGFTDGATFKHLTLKGYREGARWISNKFCVLGSISWLPLRKEEGRINKQKLYKDGYSHLVNFQRSEISPRCAAERETEAAWLLIRLQCSLFEGFHSEKRWGTSQERRRKRFVVGGRAIVRKVLMRLSGHCLPNTTKWLWWL